jgi:hypothetical protein
MTNFDRNFYIVFQPNAGELFYKRRFLVTSKTLKNYVGIYNANTALLRASNSTGDKLRVRLRKFGIIDFYVK